MTTPATATEPTPTTSDSHLSERAKHYRHILGAIVDVGGVFLRITEEDTMAARAIARHAGEPAVMPDYVGDYERLTASIRRTVMLDLSLDKPAKAARAPRQVDIAIEAAPPAPKEPVEQPEQERMERPDRLEQNRIERPDRLERTRDEDLSHLPMEPAIAIIRRDLRVTPDGAKPAKPQSAAAKPLRPSQQLQAMLKTVGETMKARQRERFSQGPPAPNIRP